MTEELIQALEFVDSIHEQREFKKKIVPLEGVWVEIGKFTPVIESFDIQERYKCIKHEHSGDQRICTLELQDHKAEEEKAKVIIEQIMAKHGENLKNTLFFALSDGVYKKRIRIETMAKITRALKDPKGYEVGRTKEKIKERIEQNEKNAARLKEQLKELEA